MALLSYSDETAMSPFNCFDWTTQLLILIYFSRIL